MIACASCGYPNDEHDYRCERCGRRFDAPPATGFLWGETEDGPAPLNIEVGGDARSDVRGDVGGGLPATVSAGKQLREEVSTRVQRFRQRRLAQASLPLDFDAAVPSKQPPLPPVPEKPPLPPVDRSRKVIPFEEIAGNVAGNIAAIRGRAALRQPEPAWAPESRSVQSPKSEIQSQNPETADWRLPTGDYRLTTAVRRPVPVETVNYPVAPLAARLIAGASDAGLLACGYALFFCAYTMMGGKFPVQRGALLALAAAVGVIAFAFTFLSLCCGGATPGMHWVGIRIVDFEGTPARRGQRALRVLGMAASGAALGFGFLWALVDEERLTWHDRISRTCLTLGDWRTLSD